MTVEDLRRAAGRIWTSAIRQADPARCLRDHLHVANDLLYAGGECYPLSGRIFVIGAGKAAAPMALAIEQVLGDRIDRGLVVTRHNQSIPLRRIQVAEAGHPVPDEDGVRAVQQMREMLMGIQAGDLVICLISGGGSALWPAPADGITLAEKQAVTGQLLRAGAGIRELNAVRKHLSSLKGGQLLRWTGPARVLTLIMSDVIGDPLDFIASGPTAPDTTTFRDALEIVSRYAIDLPTAVRIRLERGSQGEIPDTPKTGDPLFRNVSNQIVANNRLLVEAARQEGERLGFQVTVLATGIEGEAREVAGMFAAIAREIAESGNPIAPPACVLAAGETTVTVRGNGTGGRNQEMAMAWAMSIAGTPPVRPCCFASVASDGSDGPTDAAGGLVDAETCARARSQGANPATFLRDNNSSEFLARSGDRIVTGPTQTNLMDLQILLVGSNGRLELNGVEDFSAVERCVAAGQQPGRLQSSG